MNPDLLIALGGVRVVTSDDRIVAARAIIARMRAGEFADDAEASGEWMDAHTPGRIGDLDEDQVHGILRHAKKAGAVVVVLFLVVFPVASCVLTVIGD